MGMLIGAEHHRAPLVLTFSMRFLGRFPAQRPPTEGAYILSVVIRRKTQAGVRKWGLWGYGRNPEHRSATETYHGMGSGVGSNCDSGALLIQGRRQNRWER